MKINKNNEVRKSEIVETINQKEIQMKKLTKEENNLLIIATRFSVVNQAAKVVDQAITDFRFEVYDDLITKEEKQVLFEAQDIINRIKSKTNWSDAKEYFLKS